MRLIPLQVRVKILATAITLVLAFFGVYSLTQFALDHPASGPRDYLQLTETSWPYFMVALVLMAGILALFARVPDNRISLKRLVRAHGVSRETGVSGGSASKVVLQSSGEVGKRAESTDAPAVSPERADRHASSSEQRYRAVVSQSSEGIILVDSITRKVLEANAAYQKLIGMSEAQLKELSLYDLMIADRATVDRLLSEALEQGTPSLGEQQQRRGDGLPIHVEIGLTRIAHESGSVLSMVVRDVTERRWAQEALRRNEEYYRSLIDNVLNPIGIVNADGTLYYLSPSVEKILGGSVSKVIGTSAFDYVHPDDQEEVRALFRTALATPEYTTYSEFRLRGKERNWRTVEASIKNLLGNPAVVGIVFTFSDITERREAEAALRENEERYRTLFESSQDPIFIETLDLRILDCNQTACQLYGYTRDELLKLSVPDLLPEDRRSDLEVWKEATLARGDFWGESLNRKKSGEVFECEVHSRVVTLRGAQSVIVHVHDITDRRRTERVQQAVYEIAQAADECPTLEDLYRAIHRIIQSVMPANNFYIALYDEPSDLIQFVYFTDELDPTPAPKKAGRGLTEYVLRTADSFLCPLGLNEEMQRRGEVEVIGAPSLIWLGVPLMVGGKAIGVMAVQHYEREDAYGLREQQMLEFVSSQVAKAIDRKSEMLARARAEEALRESEERFRHRAEHLAVLNRIANLASQTLDVDQLLEVIYQETSNLLHPEAFFIALYDAKAQELEYRVRIDEGQRDRNDRKPLKETALTAQVITGRRPLLIGDLEAERHKHPPARFWGSGRPARSWMGVPMQMGSTVVGVISLQAYVPDAFTEEDVRLVSTIADQAAVAIEKARLSAETRQHIAELEAVNRISTALRAARTRAEMLPRLLDETLAVMGTGVGELVFYDSSRRTFQVAAARGWFSELPSSDRVHADLGALILGLHEPQVTHEFFSDSRARQGIVAQVPPGWGGAVIPIRAYQEVIGVLRLAVQLPREITPEEVHLLSTIAEIAGNAVHRATLTEETERRVQRMAALQTIDVAIGASLDLRITLNILLDQVMSQLGVDAVDVLLFRPQTQSLQFAAGRGFRSAALQHTQLRIGEGFAGRAALEREIIHATLESDQDGFRRSPLLPAEEFVVYYGVPLIAKGQVKGVLEIFHRSPLEPDVEWLSFLQALAGQAAIAIADAQLFDDLQRSNLELTLAYDATIEGWSRALEMRDQETRGHTRRVADKTIELARAMGLPETELAHMRWGALLHDIGKMAVPDNILFKPSALSEEEWVIMRKHPTFAYEMLSPISYLRPALEIPYAHHERWDGQGYPRGLRGEQIPLAARLFAVVDVWDALSSDRPYRVAWERNQVLEYIREQGEQAFDPRAVQAFLRIEADREAARQ